MNTAISRHCFQICDRHFDCVFRTSVLQHLKFLYVSDESLKHMHQQLVGFIVVCDVFSELMLQCVSCADLCSDSQARDNGLMKHSQTHTHTRVHFHLFALEERFKHDSNRCICIFIAYVVPQMHTCMCL